MTVLAQQFSEIVRDPNSDQEFQNVYAALQRLTGSWGIWKNVSYAASNFWSDAGTWTPQASDARLLKWTVINRTMIVNICVQAAATSGTVKYISVRIPSTGYKIRQAPNAATPTIGTAHGAASGNVMVIDTASAGGYCFVNNDRTDGIVLTSFKVDQSAFGGSLAGVFGQLAFEVQPQ